MPRHNRKTFILKYIEMCAKMVLPHGNDDNSLDNREFSPPTLDPKTMSKLRPAIILISNVDTTIRDIDMYFMLQKYGVIRNIESHAACFNFFHRISVKFEREVDAYNVMQKIQGMELRGISIDVELIQADEDEDLQEQLKIRLNQISVDEYCEEAFALFDSSSSDDSS